MDQVLSQAEIDALLGGISDGEILTESAVLEEPQEETVEKQVTDFDFIRFTKGKKERLPALEFIYDRFSKSFRSALSLFMEREVEVGPAPQYVEYNEFIKTASPADEHEHRRHREPQRDLHRISMPS